MYCPLELGDSQSLCQLVGGIVEVLWIATMTLAALREMPLLLGAYSSLHG